MSGQGLFLVLEGVEGAGKSTQARLLSQWLNEAGVPHHLAREPGGTPVGEAIREVLLESRHLEIVPEAELLLMLAARSAFVRQVVNPALARGEVMISDRFELSTFAYQGIARGLGLSRTRELNEFATGGVHPDLTLVFDVSIEVGRSRQSSEGRRKDRIEEENDAFFESVRQAYLTLAREDPAVQLVDATGSETEVHGIVRRLLKSSFPEPFERARGSEPSP